MSTREEHWTEDAERDGEHDFETGQELADNWERHSPEDKFGMSEAEAESMAERVRESDDRGARRALARQKAADDGR